MRKRNGIRSALVLGAVATAALVAPAGSMAATSGESYLVLYKGSGVPADAAAKVQKAGGKLVAAYDQIGVAVARSSSQSFATTLAKDSKVQAAAATKKYASQLEDSSATLDAGQLGTLPNAPASEDPLEPLMWDMRQISAPEAHAITGGSKAVVVGDIDSGLDYTHPDIAPNVDFSKSVSCVGGVPNQDPAAWMDVDGHGTHTAGTIAAASNGIGMTGVAPNVTLAGIRAMTDEGYFYPEAVVCSFMWAATHGIDVTNNSYFADPYLYNCRNDATQRAILNAEARAVRYAQSRGVTVVAAEGNEDDDLSHPSIDQTSPDNVDTPEVREITNACVNVPTELPGVIGVTSVGANEQVDGDGDADFLKAYYSSYGVSTADVAAPGGDRLFGVNPGAGAVNGRVLSTYPASLADTCARSVSDGGAFYCYLQGTSMASPHVAGVAALVISRFGDLGGRNGKMAPGKVASIVQGTADAQPCPTAYPDGYVEAATTLTTGAGEPPVCTGGEGHNAFYGHGLVNALRAVTNDRGQ